MICYLFHISKLELECSVNVFLIFWKDSERFSMFSYVVSIILMWPIFYIYGECQKYFLLLLFEDSPWTQMKKYFPMKWNYLMRGQPFFETGGHLLQISILQIRSWLSFSSIVAVTLWASCCFCKFVFKQSDALLFAALENLAIFQFLQHIDTNSTLSQWPQPLISISIKLYSQSQNMYYHFDSFHYVLKVYR